MSNWKKLFLRDLHWILSIFNWNNRKSFASHKWSKLPMMKRSKKFSFQEICQLPKTHQVHGKRCWFTQLYNHRIMLNKASCYHQKGRKLNKRSLVFLVTNFTIFHQLLAAARKNHFLFVSLNYNYKSVDKCHLIESWEA